MVIIINDEDSIPDVYPYHWRPDSSISIEEWTKKYKPSMVQNNDGTKPWLWVQNSNSAGSSGDVSQAVEEATKLLDEVTDRITSINEDDSIPLRASKKANTKSKKQVRDEVLAEYTQKLKDVHITHGYKFGKWLIFAPPEAVDGIWSRLAISVVNGPLSKTIVNLAKVATTPPNESSAQRVICVYMHDIFDKERVSEVMRVLLQHHGVNLSGVKSDLYTKIGLNSKHPSHLQSTIWKNTDFLKDSEIKELREKYFSDLKGEQTTKAIGQSSNEILDRPQNPKHKAITVVDDDPFVSEDEDGPPANNTLKRPAEAGGGKAAKKAKNRH